MTVVPGSRRAKKAALYLTLILGALLALFPMFWMISASLMPTGEGSMYPPRLLPSRITFEHYEALFTRLNLGRYLLNSALISVVVTAISLAINSMAGYAFAKLRFRGRDRLFQFLSAALVLPVQVAMLPLFLLMKQLGLINTYWGVIIPGMASIFGIFLIRQYALSLPDDLLDAARIDGAGEWAVFWRIALPLARPALATLALFSFVDAWKNFLWPLIVTRSLERRVVEVGIASYHGFFYANWPYQMAAAVTALVPVLLVFALAQRYFVRGIQLTGLR